MVLMTQIITSRAKRRASTCMRRKTPRRPHRRVGSAGRALNRNGPSVSAFRRPEGYRSIGTSSLRDIDNKPPALLDPITRSLIVRSLIGARLARKRLNINVRATRRGEARAPVNGRHLSFRSLPRAIESGKRQVEDKNSPVPALFHRERVSWRACIYRRARLSPIVVANIGVARTPARVDKLRDLAGRCVVAATAAGDRRSQRDRNFHGTASANADATQRRTTAAATDTFPLPSSSAAGPPAPPLPRPPPSPTTAGPVRAPAAKIDAIEVPAANYSRRIAERSEAGVRGGRFSRLRHNSAEAKHRRHREIGAKFVSTYEKRKSVNESLIQRRRERTPAMNGDAGARERRHG